MLIGVEYYELNDNGRCLNMSRVNIGAKPYIMPMPVLIVSSYDENDNPCAMLLYGVE